METNEVLDQIDGAIEDWAVSSDAMRMGAPPRTGLASLRPPRINSEAMRTMSVNISVAMEQFQREMAKVAKAVAVMVENNPGIRRLLGLPIHDRHHPRPLCIDGAAYQRKRNARRKRR